MALPPPPLKPCLSHLLVPRLLPLARITKSFFKILRVSLCVSSIISISLYDSYVLNSKGTTVTLLTKTAKRYEGIVASTADNEGDTTGVTLRDVKELTAPGAPVKSQLFIASTNIDSWSPVPASSNTSTPTSSTTNSRTDTKEKTLLQTLAGLTVCRIHVAHIALAHFIGSIRVRPSRSIPRLRNVMRASLPPLQGKEIRPDLVSATSRNCLIPVPLSRISSLLLHLISTPGLLVRQMLRFQTEIVGVNQPFNQLFSRLALRLVAFKTDTDISQKAPRRERELQAWQADLPPPVVTAAGPTHGHHNDDITFGAGSSGHGGWNQFTVNEKLFGVKTGFDEELYTTKLDRSGADFAEREKRAQALANEIMRVCLGDCPSINVFTVALRARRITHTS